MNHYFNGLKDSAFQIPDVCPSCSAKYNHARVSVISSNKEGIVVHVTCAGCGSSVISNISVNNMRVMAVGMLTDLSKNDLELIKSSRPISTNDVLDMHEAVEHNRFFPVSDTAVSK